jgi:ABC-2 type transport system permease protein
MRTVWTICRRELGAYFVTPVAYVFIVIFLVLAGTLTFFMGNFFDRSRADLQPFFIFHPWLYLFLVPAIGMRLWAEERKTGTIELFLTLPLTTGQAVIGKFLAAWVFCGIALLLTFPMWITVNYLGSPDNGVILASYLGSWLMAGSFLAVGAAISALTRNQVIAFVIAATICFILTVSGTDMVLGFLTGWAPQPVIDAVASFSFLQHFLAVMRGVIDLKDFIFFASMILAFLYANAIIVELKKAE